jgi:predicted metalloprotease with PDZ domain
MRIRQLGRAGLLVIVIVLAAAATAAAQTRAPIRYTLRFPAPQTNYVEVEAIVPTEGRPSVEMFMAVWTPGSYLIREYERNVEALTAAAGGRALAVEKPVKNRWRITTAGEREITVTYRVFSHEMTVRTNWVDADFAMINGAPTFITLIEHNRPHEVTVVLPPAWKTAVSAMPNATGAANRYVAADYDMLVDSPIVAGNPEIHTFTVDGKLHQLLNVGEPGTFDGARAAKDLERIVAADKALWGSLPYERYVFFNLLTETTGGLEHRNSVMMMTSRWKMATRGSYIDWLSLASHEFFHLWNVKRLRPIELGPFDYEKESYPRSLWIAEGLTDYYGDLQVRRAGITAPWEYLGLLADMIRTLQTTPGRLVQSVETASADAWIKQYRPDENSVNTVISYYTKGAVLGFVLDARIRAATNGGKSLDDVMRLALSRYSGARGYTPDQFRQAASEVAGSDLGPWFKSALETTAEIEYTPALDWYGLEFVPLPAIEQPAWIGAKTRIEAGRLLVESVPRGTPAYDAGLNPGDEILAIDDFRVLPDKYDERLQAYRPGQKGTLLVARRDALKRLPITFAADPPNAWVLVQRRNPTPEQRAHLDAWLR